MKCNLQSLLLGGNPPFSKSHATFYKSHAGEIQFQWAGQPVTVIPVSGVLGARAQKAIAVWP